MGGGLMQLVAYGAQDVYLTGNPQITFFKVVYRRHTNFAVENIEQVFNGSADFGRKVTCQISRNGDLITKMYLRVVLPAHKTQSPEQKWAWVSRVGHVFVDNVELEIGGTRIDKQYGNWLNIWYELARNWAHDRGYDIMIGNTSELTTLDQSHDEAILYIPLKFFNNRNDGLAIPLIALQYHEVKLNFEFAKLETCINRTSNLSVPTNMTISQASLYVDYVYLDTEERKRFAQAQHEYLIEQVQFTGSESVNSLQQKFRLNFNHPCKARYWTLQLGRYTSGQTFLAFDPKQIDNTRLEATKRAVLALATYNSSGQLSLQTSGVSGDIAGVLIPYDPKYKDFFDRIQPIAITNSPRMDNISILGELLTLEEISSPVSTLILYNNSNHVTSSTVPFVRNPSVPDTSDGNANLDVIVKQSDNYGIYLNKSGNPIHKVLLQLNGHDRFSERDGTYFNYVQPYQHHSNTPSDGLNMYSFALNPEEHQPSGTCNMSRIDNATLNLTFGKSTNDPTFKQTYLSADSNISIYATNYNVLRIMSGMGGLAYSN